MTNKNNVTDYKPDPVELARKASVAETAKRLGFTDPGPCPVCEISGHNPKGGKKPDRFYIVKPDAAWHCRKCGKGGDALELVMATGRTFPQAVEYLTGLKLPPRNKAARPAKLSKEHKVTKKALAAMREQPKPEPAPIETTTAEQEEQWAKMARHAHTTWKTAGPAKDDHEYLDKKGIWPFGVRQDGERLVVPMFRNGQLEKSATRLPGIARRRTETRRLRAAAII